MRVKSKFLKKMIVNKTLMAMVPIVILALFLIIGYYSIDNKRIKELHTNILVGNASTFEDRYDELLVMSGRLDKATALPEANLLGREVSYGLLDVMQSVSLPRTFYCAFVYIPNGNDYLYTASYTTCPKSDFLAGNDGSIAFYGTSNAEIAAISARGEHEILPCQRVKVDGKTYEGVPIVSPIGNNGTNFGSLVAVVDSTAIRSLFGGVEEGGYGTALVRNGKTLYGDFEFEPSALGLNDLGSGETSVKKINENYYFCVKTYFSDVYAIRFYQSSAWKNVALIYVMMAAVVALCLGWVATFIYISIRTEYVPLENISKNLRKFMLEESAEVEKKISPGADEIEAVGEMINLLFELKNRDRAPVGENAAGFDFPSAKFAFSSVRAHYSVMALSASAGGAASVTPQEITAQAGEAEVDCAVAPDGNVLIAAAYDGNNQLNTFISRVESLLESRYGAEGYRLAIGMVVDKEENVPRSLFEAAVSLRYMSEKNVTGVYYCDFMFQNNLGQNKRVIDLISRFDYNLKTRDARGMDDVFTDIEEFMNAPDASPDNCKALFFFVKNNFLYEFHNSMHDLGADKLGTLINMDVNETGIMSMVLRIIQDCTKELFAGEKDEKQSGVDKEELREYIAEHYLDPDFSLNTLAEKFSCSSSGFSKIFKATFDVNFKSYVDAMKMKEAQRLLAETDMTIDEIAEKLNYSNASNFLRAFKSQFVVSPGQYRKNVRTTD